VGPDGQPASGLCDGTRKEQEAVLPRGDDRNVREVARILAECFRLYAFFLLFPAIEIFMTYPADFVPQTMTRAFSHYDVYSVDTDLIESLSHVREEFTEMLYDYGFGNFIWTPDRDLWLRGTVVKGLVGVGDLRRANPEGYEW